ncbi:Metallophosphatase [Pandoravirus dulcis]|uniref:Metallophosphatase n=1 Tax=Pandoravirus dulcis TaxID=1349409 RepID=S4VP02_9VIRU|nr:metallo-phosphoesterase [Pandoravirus dulcis]AGO81993.2 Metallophosphatase [Pandoravirus dulcis]
MDDTADNRVHADDHAEKSSEGHDATTATVRIQVASDLHLELRDAQAAQRIDDIIAPTGASVLALVGDIGSPVEPSYATFIAAAAARYAHVLVIAGNHEYYGGSAPDAPTMADLAAAMRETCAAHANVHFLDDDAIVLDGVRYVGSTLWSFVPEAFRRRCTKDMNDYHLIRVAGRAPDAQPKRRASRWTVIDTYADGEDDCRWRGGDDGDDDDSVNGRRSSPPTLSNGDGLLTVDDTNALHAAAVDFLNEQIAEAAAAPEDCRQPVVVLTHHAPSFKSIHRRYATSLLTCAFVTDLERLMRPPVALWLHGHTHTASDYEVETCSADGATHTVRVVNNPMGYRQERAYSGYVKDKVVEVVVPRHHRA